MLKVRERPIIRMLEPMPHQQPVIQHQARFKVLACGRRWGKDILGMWAVVLGHGPTNPVTGRPLYKGAIHGGNMIWATPIYKQSTEMWEMLKYALRNVWVHKDEQERRILLPGGGVVWVRTADNPDALRGTGLDGCVLNEAAYMDEEVWNGAIRPALSDKLGWCIFCSTPNGEANWFHGLFQRAMGDDWARWQRPTSDNPKVLPSELDAAKREMGELKYRQEYEADFTAVATLAFPTFRPFIDEIPYHVIPDEYIPAAWNRVGGFDWGWARGGVLWAAFQPASLTGSPHIRIYQEYDFRQMPPDALATSILLRQGPDYVPEYFSDGIIWGRRGHDNMTERQKEILAEHGELKFTIYKNLADAGFANLKPSRVNPFERFQMTQMALREQDDGWPLMLVHETCPVLIDSLLNLQVDENNQDRVESDYKAEDRVQDHLYDCLGHILGNAWERLHLEPPVAIRRGRGVQEERPPADKSYRWGF